MSHYFIKINAASLSCVAQAGTGMEGIGRVKYNEVKLKHSREITVLPNQIRIKKQPSEKGG